MDCDAGEDGVENNQLSHVEEDVEIQDIVKRILHGDHAQTGKEYPRFKLIVSIPLDVAPYQRESTKPPHDQCMISQAVMRDCA